VNVPNQGSITVALVEDDAGTRDRLTSVISGTAALRLIHTAATASGAMAWLREGRPHVLLVDLGLPDGSGIDVIRHCRRVSPLTEVMVVTMFGDEANMLRAFEAGARGYLLKDGTEDELARHVMDLHAGGSPMSPLIARQLVARISQPVAAGGRHPAPVQNKGMVLDTLSPRESEILSLIARGYTYAELGKLLSVSLSTVQTHVRSIYSKLAVHSKTEAVFEARQMGLLDR
jgi:DNA-binding NarL/FixJ family response regulator